MEVGLVGVGSVAGVRSRSQTRRTRGRGEAAAGLQEVQVATRAVGYQAEAGWAAAGDTVAAAAAVPEA